MRFSSMLARKYIFAQKRHSLLTILSIAAAVTLITVIFTVFSTFWTCMRNIEEYENPWHATIYGITREQAEQLSNEDYIAKYDYREYTDDSGSGDDMKTATVRITSIMFDKKAEDPPEQVLNSLKRMGISEPSTGGWSSDDPDAVALFINDSLLTYHMIGYDAKFAALQYVAILYIFVLFIVFCARFVIDTAFEISSKEREKQYGVLRSIGASKKQIVRILLSEGGHLSIVGIPLGLGLGIGAAFIIYKAVLSSGIINNFTEDAAIADKVIHFTVSPILLILTAVTGLVWALLSAYGTGMRAAKMSPIEAMRSRGTTIKKVKRRSFGGMIFGWTGKLAARNIRRSKKRFIITVLSVTLSITLFVAFSYAVELFKVATISDLDGFYYDFSVDVYDIEAFELKDPEKYVKPEKYDYKQVEKQLKDSGLFKNVRADLAVFGNIGEVDDAASKLLDIRFVNEETYDRMMGGEPEIPYSELVKENGFVLLRTDEMGESTINDVTEPFTVKVHNWEYYDEPVEVENAYGETEWEFRETGMNYSEDINILKVYDEYSADFKAVGEYYYGSILIGTQEQFEYWDKYSVSLYYGSFYLDIADGVTHSEAVNFVKSCGYEVYNDVYSYKLNNERIISAITIFGYAIDALIAVIAIINMVNIISTGIINRRAEIAAMKSLGMNNKQLRKMLLLECFGYVSVSGVTAAILGTAMYICTGIFVSSIGFMSPEITWDYLGQAKTLLNILPLMLAAFAVGIIATAIPLRSINKTPITESMRSVD